MTNPNTPASPTEQRCPDCQRFPCVDTSDEGCFYADHCERDRGPQELATCQSFAITRLRSTLATLQAAHDALVADAQAAVERSDRSAPKERDNISRNTLAEDIGRALIRAKAGR